MSWRKVNVLKKANQAFDMTMVIVTHEIGFAEKVASRLIFIDKGRIAEDGNPQALIENPPSQRLQEFLQHVS